MSYLACIECGPSLLQFFAGIAVAIIFGFWFLTRFIPALFQDKSEEAWAETKENFEKTRAYFSGLRKSWSVFDDMKAGKRVDIPDEEED